MPIPTPVWTGAAPVLPAVVTWSFAEPLAEGLGEPLAVTLTELELAELAELEVPDAVADGVDEAPPVQPAEVGTWMPFAPQRLTAKSMVSA
jgi:hypothetical protein